MRTLAVVATLVAGMFLVADELKSAEDKDAVKKEMAKFQGNWKAVSILRNGEEGLPEEDLKKLLLTVEGDKRILKVDDNVVSRGTYKLDPTKKPKAIDITVAEGPLQGKTVVGIYEIDGDTQKICLALEGTERPKEFSSKADSGHLLQVFKREKKQ
jgi:uncharacterized protein (TIGR03067 family)